MVEYSGSGDPRRSLELLWGVAERSARGPKARLSVARITEAAVHLADADGLAALSMRRVADALGVGAMSLYTYVPGKAELLDLMVDQVSGDMARTTDARGWRARLEQVARENWALYRRHPWLLQVATTRPGLGPNQTAKYEHELGAVDGIGLTDEEMDSVLTLVLGFAHSAARGAVDADEAQRRTGMTDAQWWEAHAPVLGSLIDAEKFPLATRVGEAAGAAHNAAYAPEHAFEFGLSRVLDGIAVLVTARE
jgi:AcrR family transcriptional regulator